MAEQQRGTPPGFTHSGGISTQAFDPFYNPSTGETWTASIGGFTPGPGWVRGTPPAGTESRYTQWVAPEQDASSGDGTISPGSAQAVAATSTPSMAGGDQLDTNATQNLRNQGITSLNAYRDVNGGLYYATVPRIRAEGARGTDGGRRARVAIDSAGPIGSYPQPEAPTYRDAQPGPPTISTTPTPESQIIDRSDYRHPEYEAWAQEYELEQAEDDRVAEEIYEKAMTDPNNPDGVWDPELKRLKVWGWVDGERKMILAPKYGESKSSFTTFEDFFNAMLAGGINIGKGIEQAVANITADAGGGLANILGLDTDPARSATDAPSVKTAPEQELGPDYNLKEGEQATTGIDMISSAIPNVARPDITEGPLITDDMFGSGPRPAPAPAILGPRSGPVPAPVPAPVPEPVPEPVPAPIAPPPPLVPRAPEPITEEEDYMAYQLAQDEEDQEKARAEARAEADYADEMQKEREEREAAAQAAAQAAEEREAAAQAAMDDDPYADMAGGGLVKRNPYKYARGGPVDRLPTDLEPRTIPLVSNPNLPPEAEGPAPNYNLEEAKKDYYEKRKEREDFIRTRENYNQKLKEHEEFIRSRRDYEDARGYAEGGLVDRLPADIDTDIDIETPALAPLAFTPGSSAGSESQDPPLPNYNLAEDKKDFYAKQKERQDLVRVRENYAEGGLVNRRSKEGKSPPNAGVADDLLRNLSEGEYVIPKHIVDHFGEKFFEDLLETIPPPKKTLVQLRI